MFACTHRLGCLVGDSDLSGYSVLRGIDSHCFCPLISGRFRVSRGVGLSSHGGCMGRNRQVVLCPANVFGDQSGLVFSLLRPGLPFSSVCHAQAPLGRGPVQRQLGSVRMVQPVHRLRRRAQRDRGGARGRLLLVGLGELLHGQHAPGVGGSQVPMSLLLPG